MPRCPTKFICYRSGGDADEGEEDPVRNEAVETVETVVRPEMARATERMETPFNMPTRVPLAAG